jgi:Ca2+-binding RTX toxin-like protein
LTLAIGEREDGVAADVGDVRHGALHAEGGLVVGDDTLDGGDGTDTVNYSTSSNDLTINLLTGTATGAGTDSLSGDENVIGGSGDDTITGDSAPNEIYGGDGSDVIHGGQNNDKLDGQAGPDAVYGDTGQDVCVKDESDSAMVCTFSVAFSLEMSRLVSGVVHKSDGSVLANALYMFEPNDPDGTWGWGYTGSDGSYSVALAAGSYHFTLGSNVSRAAENLPEWFVFSGDINVTADRTFSPQLPAPTKVIFTVQDASGNPISGANVYSVNQVSSSLSGQFDLGGGFYPQISDSLAGGYTNADGQYVAYMYPGSLEYYVDYTDSEGTLHRSHPTVTIGNTQQTFATQP